MENVTILLLQIKKQGEKTDIVICKMLNFQASYLANDITSHHHPWVQMTLDPAFELSFQIFFLSIFCFPCERCINVFKESYWIMSFVGTDELLLKTFGWEMVT